MALSANEIGNDAGVYEVWVDLPSDTSLCVQTTTSILDDEHRVRLLAHGEAMHKAMTVIALTRVQRPSVVLELRTELRQDVGDYSSEADVFPHNILGGVPILVACLEIPPPPELPADNSEMN